MRIDTDSFGERIAEHVAHIDAAMHLLLTDLREFDQAGGWYHQGFQTCAHWLSWRVGWTLGTAREHVRVAGKLAELPQIDEALRTGEMSYSKVRAMTRVATPANEHTLLEEASHTTGHQLETICRKYAMVQRHDKESNAKDDSERRYIKRRDQSDGMVQIVATLHPEEAATVWAALERIVKEGSRAHDRAAPHAIAGCMSELPAATPSSESVRSSVLSVPNESSESNLSSALTVSNGSSASTESHKSRLSTLSSIPSVPNASSQRAGVNDLSQCLSADVPAGTRSAEPRRAYEADDRSDARSDGNLAPPHSNVPAGTFGSDTAHKSERRRDQESVRAQRFSRADALVAMAEEVIRGSRPNRSPIELVVTVAASDLKARPSATSPTTHDTTPIDAACYADGTAVSLAVARRLACDAGLVGIVEDNDGAVLSVGRKTRTIPGAMKRALLRRDRCCRFPGCSNRIFLEGHHAEHWADGGATKLGNLVSLCGYHHRFVHEYGYKVEIRGAEVRFLGPDGKALPAIPEVVRPERLGWETIRARNAELAIDADTPACGWDGGRIDLVACIDELVRADDYMAH